ncbi:MAG: DciA family protein [Planctomycetota bacterium]|jgi:hypothetical protein
MKEDDLLKGASSWQWKVKPTSSRLGDELFSYFEQRSRTFEKNSAIIDAWQEIVPPAIQRVCMLDKCVGNTLYVQVMAGPYMHQVQMLTGEWIDRLRQRCPRCGITKIRLTPM